MAKEQKTPLVFFRAAAGGEPVREWLKTMNKADRHAVGPDLMRAQWRWPVRMPLCCPTGEGLWEVRSSLPSDRIARVLFCIHEGQTVALHGLIKKSRATRVADLELARKRMKELEK